MKLENIKVYDFEESLIASGYPMRTEVGMRDPDEKDFKRGLNLTTAFLWQWSTRSVANWRSCCV